MAGIPLGGEEELVAGRKTPIVTIGLVVANVIVYLITSAPYLFVQTSNYYIFRYGFVPAVLLQNPLEGIARIFTSMFIHANLLHIFFNMYFLYIFGRAVENVLGRGRYLALYLASGVAAALFHTAFTYLGGPSQLVIPAVGASGAISGVLGAYMILFPATSLTVCWWFFIFPFCFTLRASTYLIFWFALQVIEGYMTSSMGGAGIAFFAHVGGFLTGIALLPLIVNWVRHRYLRMRSEVIHYLMGFIRRSYEVGGLGPLAKAVMTALIIAVLAGSAYSMAQSMQLFGVYEIKSLEVFSYPSMAPLASYTSIIVNVQQGGASLGIGLPYVRVFLNRLIALKLFWDPSWSSRVGTWWSGEVRILGVEVPVRLLLNSAKYSMSRLIFASGSMITTPVYIKGGVEKLGAPILYKFSIESLFLHPQVMQIVSLSCIGLSLLTLYALLRKSEKLALVT